MKKVLIDSNYLCHKAKVTTGTLSYGGQPTGIVFGFINQLITIAKTTGSKDFLFFWDSKKSKRREIYPEYKMKRRPELTEWEQEDWKLAFSQFVQLRKRILPQIGFKNNHLQSGYEADDLIARYVMDSKNDGLVIATADADLLQLLGYADMLNLSKNKLITQRSFVKEYGISPTQWGQVKQIAGCSSDNVAGIPGVGEKTALRFLTGTLPETHKSYQRIKASEDIIERNRALVVLPFNGTKAIEEQEDNFKITEFMDVCRELGMTSLLSKDRKEEIKSLFIKERKQVRYGKKERSEKGNDNGRSSGKSH